MKPKGKGQIKADPLAAAKLWLAGVDRKELIQIGIIAGALLAFIFIFFLPVLGRNRQAAVEVFRLTNQLRTATNSITRLPEMKKQKEVYGVRIEQVRKAFFRNEELKQLIEIISTTATQNKVRITGTQPVSKELVLPEPFQQIYRVVSYELTLEGGYHELGTFINQLEQHSKNFDIPELKISRGEGAPGIQKAVLVVNAYLERAQIK